MILTLWSQAASATGQPSCPGGAPMSSEALSPDGLVRYFDLNRRVNDATNFVCCLPKAVRGSYVVAHNSDAGQSGNPHGPRVLMYPPKASNDEATVPFVFSINGGGHDLNNPHNVEMFYRDPVTREVSLYDIGFEKGRPKITKNPAECILCHGAQGQLTAAGLHPNLQPFAKWTRLGGGVVPCAGPETAYLKAVNAVAERALRTNPRYKCLDRDTFVAKDNFRIAKTGFFATGVVDLDRRLEKINDERTARILHATADYEKYKYAIVGAMLCMTDPPSWAEWIPPNQLRRHDDVSHLGELAAKAQDLKGAYRAGLQMRGSEQKRLTAKLSADAKSVLSGKNPEFHLPQQRTTCVNERGQDLLDGEGADEPAWSGLRAYDRFALDQAVRAPNGLQAPIRFLIEGRGIGLEDIDMDALGGDYGRALDQTSVADELLKLEPADSRLLGARSDQKIGLLFEGVDARTAFCGKIKALSQRAFAMTSAERAAPTPVPAAASH